MTSLGIDLTTFSHICRAKLALTIRRMKDCLHVLHGAIHFGRTNGAFDVSTATNDVARRANSSHAMRASPSHVSNLLTRFES